MAGKGLYLYSRVVVDGHLFRAHPHILYQDEFYGGRHRHKRVVLKGKASTIRSRRQQVNPVQSTGLPPTPWEEQDRGPRSWCHHRALVMSGTRAPVNPCRNPAERPHFFEASHNPAKASAPILPARLHVGGSSHTHLEIRGHIANDQL